jgi:nitroimidazol reductase NimA-like FMN-containing flavoprotein (pyridoxamine 5'-phosphate oxidase superfamily)
MYKEIRRKDRALDSASAWAVLKNSKYGVLSTVDKDNQPYGTPVSYVVVDNSIFIHSATEGHKLENITSNSKVSFCVVGKTELLPGEFSTRYESAIVFGTAKMVDGENEKRKALEALLAKYSPGYLEAGKKYIDKLFDKVVVMQVSIDHITGKSRK